MRTESNEDRKRRYRERLARGVEYLGGRCVTCGSTDELQFDHKDPTTKSFTVSTYYWMAWDRWVQELDKCQLLCIECHHRKTGKEAAARLERHGAWSKCRCDECRDKYNAYQRAWYAKKKARLGMEE